jgi:hypothetical protein
MPPPKSRAPLFIALGAAVLVLVIAIVGIFLTNNSGSSRPRSGGGSFNSAATNETPTPAPTPTPTPPSTPTPTPAPTPAPTPDPTPTPTPTPTPRPPSSLWTELYINHIYENSDRGAANADYALVFIDDDEIPEMVISYRVTAYGGDLCTSDNNTMETVYIDAWGMQYYLEGEGLYLDRGGHMGEFYDIVYRVQDGRISELQRGDYYDTVELCFFWDGIEVSEDEYYHKLNAIFDMSRAREVFESEITITSDEALYILNNW